jgi:lipid-A-disaccharide synthase
MNFLLSAGEASGDTYGAQLAQALGKLAPNSTFFGMGGEKMRAAGCHLLIDAKDVAVVGLIEVVKHLPDIRRRFRQLVKEAARRRPDAAVLIDFPDFNLRLARELHRLGIPVFYFVSPQIWAWRTGRVKQIQKYVRKMIVIFPFEQEFYRDHGVEVSYVGHPLAYAPAPTITREEFAAKHKLDPNKQWIALLPGSRRKEVRLNLAPMVVAAELLGPKGNFEFVLPVASTLTPEILWQEFQNRPRPKFVVERRPDEPVHPLTITLSATIHCSHDARATLMHARAAVVASGTATVEAALSGTPFVVVYRLAPLTWILGRRLVKLSTFAMPNLIAGEKIVPELIQRDFTAENVVRELSAIIPDGPARSNMQAALKMVQQRLRDQEHAEPPATRAAREILASLGGRAAL